MNDILNSRKLITNVQYFKTQNNDNGRKSANCTCPIYKFNLSKLISVD